MATNCGDCENPDYTPEAACCPDTTDSGHSVDVRDRNCKIRRLLATPGLLGSLAGRAKFLDGSDEFPIQGMRIVTVEGSEGSVVVQDASGRILGIIPDGESSVTEYFSSVGGVMAFRPIEVEIAFDDETLPITKLGPLIGLVCLSDGRLQLAKYIPGCEGSRYLVIQEDGSVACDEGEIDDCKGELVEDSSIGMDYILGCVDGKIVRLAPEEDKVLKYELVSGNPKWVLGDAVSEETWVGAEIWNYAIANQAQTNLATQVIPFGGSVPGTATWVQISVNIEFAQSTAQSRGYVYINGVPVILTRNSGNFQSHQGQTALYVPYGSGTFTLRIQNTPFVVGSDSADGRAVVNVLSYR